MFLQEYASWLRSEHKSSNTITVYVNSVKKLMEWYEQKELQSFSPELVTTLHLQDFYDELDKVEKKEPGTINKIMASIKSFFKFATDKGLTFANPAAKVKIKRSMKQDQSPQWIGRYEQAKYFHAIAQNTKDWMRIRDMAISRMMVGAGLRVQEVADLRIGDVSIERRREVVTVRGGKGGKFRQLPLNSDVIGAMKDWLEIRKTSNDTDPLFIGQGCSRGMSVRSIHKLVNKYANQAGLHGVSPHTLRHTFCKNLIDQSVPIRQVAFLAGHDDIRTTMRYTLPSENDNRQAVEKISENRRRDFN
ncbi:tyrosine-type recombinase/integrase [Streptomyces avermitilis]